MTWTRLHDAVQHQNKEMVVQLSQFNANEAMMVDDHGSTPLHLACWNNPPVDIVTTLLRACPHSACDQDVDGNTPLHIAASRPVNSVEIVQTLLNASPTAASMKNKEGLMPLHMACRYAPKNDSILLCLTDFYPEALEVRTKMGHLEQEGSVAASKTPNKENNPNHQHFVTDLAEKANFDVSATRNCLGEQFRDGSFPLLMAIQHGASCRTIESMLCHHMNQDLLRFTNKYYETALHFSLAREDGDKITHFLLESPHSYELVQTKENRHGNLPVHIAAIKGCSTEVMQDLLRLGPDTIFTKNNNGRTPLDLAIEYGLCSEEVVRMLEISEHCSQP